MLYTGLADGRIVGFKGGELWEVTRTGELHPDCGKLKSNIKTARPRCRKNLRRRKFRKHLSGFFSIGSFELEPVCGRPKGMKVNTADPSQPLIVLDSYRGLLQVDTNSGAIQVLLHSSTGCYKS